MLAPQGVGFPCLYGYRCLAIPSDTHPRISPHLLFVVWLQKGSMDKEYIIFQEDGLFGAKDQKGKVVIPPQYMEMQPFSCGLSLVRNHQGEYAYIDITNRQAVPFGLYFWCAPQFTCGFARVIECVHHEKDKSILMGGKWGIIDTLGNVIVPFKYDKIWTLKEEYLFSIKAFINEKEERLNLHELATNTIFDGLTYICTYSVEAFKDLVNCNHIYVKEMPNTGQLYFTYGVNIGLVYLKAIPQEPVISIVANSSGKIFPLLMEKADIGKTTLPPTKATPKRIISKTASHKTSFWDYESGKMNDADDWSDPYGDEQAFYSGWNREDVESGLADAYEGNIDAKWNND